MTSEFVYSLNDPGGQLAILLGALKSSCRSRGGRFVLCVGSTETSDVPGISAAGASPELRRLTPSIDAEVLVLGRTVGGQRLPVSPAGIVSPVVITRAALRLLGLPVIVVDCGSFRPPAVERVTAGIRVARCLSTGRALDQDHVEQLFEAGVRLGNELRSQCDYLILAECVPAGTTTALGLLTALGQQVNGLISSSLPESDHAVRQQLVDRGAALSGLSAARARRMPLLAVAALGDPMQPVAAGIALSASQRIPVVMAGGSQMLAVWALVRTSAGRQGVRLPPGNLGVITTKWVAFDRSAGSSRLASLLEAPFAAACPDFTRSRHGGLRAYERGHVKEGVGAGGAMAVASLTGGASPEQILQAIDTVYDELVLAG